MKKLINKYFDFIGVENEGWRRIFLIVIILLIILMYVLTIELVDDVIYYSFDSDFLEFISRIISFFVIIPSLSPIIVGIVVKTFFWVKDGFSK